MLRPPGRHRTVGVVVAAVLVLVGGLLLAYPDRAGAADPLISRDHTATSSSDETSDLGPQNAFDGDPATRWASAEGKDPQWIAVDLGDGAQVSRVKLGWEDAYAKAYRIEIMSTLGDPLTDLGLLVMYSSDLGLAESPVSTT
ncbi:discoidin domain-containing protein, partial [Streptomyces sp. NPDC001274]